MNEHTLFYYPYASFTNTQLPLLKVAALYFDRLIILDPVGASWNTVGADYQARDAVKLLMDEKIAILQTVMPADVLAKYAGSIRDAVRQDMNDPEFLALCAAQSRATGKQRWTLSLEKVPQDLQTDQSMRDLMGDFARDVVGQASQYNEQVAGDYREYAETGQAYDEYREGYSGNPVEYRYADFPLALGEAIMINHALFAGLLYSGATPITDDTFHNEALSLKLRRATLDTVVRQAQAERARQSRINLLALSALTDFELKLPMLDPKIPLQEALNYRQKHADALGAAREKLGRMARRMEAEPWSKEFAAELEHKTIPDIADELDNVRKARDDWLKHKRIRRLLKVLGIAVGGTTAVLVVIAAPLTPIALATAGLSLASGAAIPGAEWLLDWRDGKRAVQENGLHYLLSL
jgi:hypothetical protein